MLLHQDETKKTPQLRTPRYKGQYSLAHRCLALRGFHCITTFHVGVYGELLVVKSQKLVQCSYVVILFTQDGHSYTHSYTHR